MDDDGELNSYLFSVCLCLFSEAFYVCTHPGTQEAAPSNGDPFVFINIFSGYGDLSRGGSLGDRSSTPLSLPFNGIRLQVLFVASDDVELSLSARSGVYST